MVKASVLAYTKTLADAGARFGVRAKCVVPGIIETDAIMHNATETATATGRTVDEVMEAMVHRYRILLD